MRAIKFRGWNKVGRRMINLKAMTEFAKDATLSQDGLFLPFSEDIKLMQFTGLRDTSGVEIYEGDIVQSLREYNDYTGMNSELYGGSKYEVKNSGWRFHLAPQSIYSVDLTALKIIGNIYENPELLTETT